MLRLKTMNIIKTTLLCLLLSTSQMTLAQNQTISPGEAAARVQQEVGGRILSVETIQRKNKTFYRIKVLTRKGVVRVMRVNAENGRTR